MGRCRKLLKNFQLETILNIPGHVALANVDVWFQDEARFGQQNTTTRLWARRGSRPRAIQQQQFEYVYLFGAVCPATGTTEALLSPLVNREVMKQHLALIAARTKPGRHAVVIMDGAGWHTMECADDFPNLSLIKLPPILPNSIPLNRYGAGFVSMCWLIAASRITTTSLMPAHRPGSTLLPMWSG